MDDATASARCDVPAPRSLDATYGVRPSETYTLRDQLGLVPGTKSKVEDGSDTGTSGGEVVTVADFR